MTPPLWLSEYAENGELRFRIVALEEIAGS